MTVEFASEETQTIWYNITPEIIQENVLYTSKKPKSRQYPILGKFSPN